MKPHETEGAAQAVFATAEDGTVEAFIFDGKGRNFDELAHKGLVTSYAHIGQHAEADERYAEGLKQAEDPSELLAELRAIYGDGLAHIEASVEVRDICAPDFLEDHRDLLGSYSACEETKAEHIRDHFRGEVCNHEVSDAQALALSLAINAADWSETATALEKDYAAEQASVESLVDDADEVESIMESYDCAAWVSFDLWRDGEADEAEEVA